MNGVGYDKDKKVDIKWIVHDNVKANTTLIYQIVNDTLYDVREVSLESDNPIQKIWSYFHLAFSNATMTKHPKSVRIDSENEF